MRLSNLEYKGISYKNMDEISDATLIINGVQTPYAQIKRFRKQATNEFGNFSQDRFEELIELDAQTRLISQETGQKHNKRKKFYKFNDKIVTVDQIAEMQNVSVKTIRRNIESGKLILEEVK